MKVVVAGVKRHIDVATTSERCTTPGLVGRHRRRPVYSYRRGETIRRHHSCNPWRLVRRDGSSTGSPRRLAPVWRVYFILCATLTSEWFSWFLFQERQPSSLFLGRKEKAAQQKKNRALEKTWSHLKCKRASAATFPSTDSMEVE